MMCGGDGDVRCCCHFLFGKGVVYRGVRRSSSPQTGALAYSWFNLDFFFFAVVSSTW